MFDNPGLYDETQWNFAIQFNDADGVGLDLSGRENLRCVFYDTNGAAVFTFTGGSPSQHDGSIDLTESATGRVLLQATTEQHSLVPESRPYTWTLYDDETTGNPFYLANGTAYVGRPGEKTTSFRVLNSYPGSIAGAVVVGIKGDKGNTGDITEALEALRDEVFSARDEAEEARDDAQGFADDAEGEAEEALTARIAAEAAQALAEAASLAALAGQTIYADKAAGIAAVADGAPFWAHGTVADTLDLWRRNGGDADLKFTAGGITALNDITLRVEAIEPIKDVIVAYLDQFPDEKPLHIYDDATYDDYLKKRGDDDWVHVSPETARLDNIERGGVPASDLTPEYSGRVILSSDGSIIGGRRVRDGFTQNGPAPEREYGADIIDGKVWVTGEGIAPFCVSGEQDDTNRALRHHGHEGVSWFNETAQTYHSFGFLGGFEADALSDDVTSLIALVGTGQSTANGTESRPVLTDESPEPGHLFMYDVTPPGGTTRGVRVLGHEQGPNRSDEYVDPLKLGLLVEAQESSEANAGETQWSQAAYELQKRMGAAYAVATGTVAIGSVPYSGVKKGTAPYFNLLAMIRNTWAIAKLRGLDFNVVVAWPQHEGNVAFTQAQYLAAYTEFQADVSADVALITDGEITNVLFVTNGFTNGTTYGATHTEQSLAQLQFALENPAKGIYATPCFTLPRVADKTHYSNVGSARDGAYIGRAVANKLLGRDALPLYTTAVSIVSGDIRGALHLPYGAGALTDTSPFVTDPGNLGFSLVRADNQVEVPIAQALIASNEWRVTPLAPPAGVPLEIAHGYRGTIGASGGPTTGARSPINDGNADLDFFGAPFPNHLAAQKFTVTF